MKDEEAATLQPSLMAVFAVLSSSVRRDPAAVPAQPKEEGLLRRLFLAPPHSPLTSDTDAR